jgi:hypothetical protein
MQTLEPEPVRVDRGDALLAEPTASPPRRAVRIETLLRGTIAAAMLGAAGIHFGMMGEHAGVSWSHGVFFATVAWLQVALAVLVLLRPVRLVALGGVLLNLAVLGVWIVSRTAGISIGGDGTPEQWGTVDAVCAAFEIVAVLACIGLLVRGFAQRPLSSGVGAASIAFVGLAVVVLTALVFSPALLDDAGDGVSADGHNHGAGGEAAPAADHHAAAPVDDRGLGMLGNGHHEEIGPEKPLTVEERTLLSHQIAITQSVAQRYPTVAAAEAAGYRRAGPYSPGLGAHYIKPSIEGLNADGVVDDKDAASPLSIIYDGTTPDSRVAGFMYYAASEADPQGFAGPNDIWHYHTNVCLKGMDTPLGADTSVSKKLCDSIGGTLMEKTAYMVHVWSVPGWESQQGLFGEVNPALTCPDGSYRQWPRREWVDHLLNTCRSAA